MPHAETTTVATTTSEVEALRDAWARAGVKNIDADIDYFSTVIENLDGASGPYVVRVHLQGGRDLFAVARIEEARIPLKLGYRTVASIKLKALVLAFDGFLGVSGPADIQRILSSLLDGLGNGVAEVAILQNLDQAGDTWALAQRSVGWFRRLHGQGRVKHWRADVSTPDRFLCNRSEKTRKRTLTQQRKLERDFAGRMRLERFHKRDQAGILARDMAKVAALSYQTGLGSGFQGRSLDHAMLELGLRRGWHRTWMLYIDERPVAFWTGTVYQGVFAIGTPGFDPEYVKNSVGRYTMLRMLEDCCNDPDIQVLDFGAGDGDYKTAHGDNYREECATLLFAARPRPIAANLAISALAGVNSIGRVLVRRFGMLDRLKKAWRSRRSGANTFASLEAGEST